MNELKSTERRFDDVTILDFQCDIIIGLGTTELRQQTRRLIEEGRVRIILNLADVKYVDSSGLGEMVAALTTAARRGGDIVLLNVSENVLHLLKVTKLATVFAIYDDERKAIEGIREGLNG
jgi:anti-sigma B factor antagonist